MAEKSSILTASSTYVQQYLLENLPPGRLYHNFAHAEEVAKVCVDLGKKANLTEEDKEILELAAWFHDCGYANRPESVAEGSVIVVRQFLQEQNYSEKRTEKIVQLIRSIHGEEPPTDDLEKILHDANYSFFGRKRFSRRSKLLRLEKMEMEGKKFDSYKWRKKMLKNLISHKFYTSWAQDRFSKRLNKNIANQRKDILKAFKKTTRKKTGKDFGRGVDTIYRVTLRNHINLSRIADGKANMIISINTLVLSILITAGVAGLSLDQTILNSNMLNAAPILALMITSLLTIVIAVFSAIPKTGGQDFDEEDIKQHQVSLLFFGNFLRLEKPRFVQHLRELKQDQDLLYDDLSRDLYNLGVVLKKKYRLLKLAYRIFIGGLILSFLLFMASWLV